MVTLVRAAEQDGDHGTAYLAEGYLRLDQFDFELGQALGSGGNVGLVVDGDVYAASTAAPALLFVQRPCPPSTVVATAAVHVPSEDWFPTASTTITIAEVVAKAAAGGVLGPEEVQVALRALLAKGV